MYNTVKKKGEKKQVQQSDEEQRYSSFFFVCVCEVCVIVNVRACVEAGTSTERFRVNSPSTCFAAALGQDQSSYVPPFLLFSQLWHKKTNEEKEKRGRLNKKVKITMVV